MVPSWVNLRLEHGNDKPWATQVSGGVACGGFTDLGFCVFSHLWPNFFTLFQHHVECTVCQTDPAVMLSYMWSSNVCRHTDRSQSAVCEEPNQAVEPEGPPPPHTPHTHLFIHMFLLSVSVHSTFDFILLLVEVVFSSVITPTGLICSTPSFFFRPVHRCVLLKATGWGIIPLKYAFNCVFPSCYS